MTNAGVGGQDAAALRIVCAHLQKNSGELTEDQVSHIVQAELAATVDPLDLLSAVADVGVKLLGVLTEVLRHEPAAVLRTLSKELIGR